MTASLARPVDYWTLNASGLVSLSSNWSNGLPLKGGAVVVAPTSPVVLTFDVGNFTLSTLTLQGATVALQSGVLAVAAGATLKSATISGPHAMIVGGASQVTGLTVEGAAIFYNRGVVTQSGGAVEIGTSKTSRAIVDNLAGANWIDSDNSGVTQGTGAGGWFLNHGQFTDSAPGGVAYVSTNFLSDAAVSVAKGGTLELNGPRAMLSGTLEGGGLLEYGAAVTATLGAMTVAATNQTNNGIVNQTGTMTLTGAQTILNNHIWNFDGDVSMLADSGAQFLSYPQGLVAKTAGTGVSVVSASVGFGGGTDVATGTLEFEGASSGFAGSIYGAGTLEIAAGAAEFEGHNPSESISVAHLLLAGGTTSVLSSVTVSGAFETLPGAILSLSAPIQSGFGNGVLTLTGSADLSGLDVTASTAFSQLVVDSTANVSGLTIGGIAQLFDNGVVTQTQGTVTLGDAVALDAASIVLANGGIWNIADASDIALGSDPNSLLNVGYNGTQGLLEKSGAGVSTISPIVVNNSANVITSGGVQYGGLEAGNGTLDVQNVVAGTGTDNIVGAATLEFGNAVQAGQTVSFFGSGGTLQIDNISNFSAAITGFDTVGSNDALLIGLNMQFMGATETATAATLNFAAGSHAFALTLTGDYRGGTFTAQSLGIGGPLKITY